MSYTACQLWPDVLSTQAQIEFWLQSPEIDPRKAEATREALPTMLGNRLRQCWINLQLHLGKVRDTAVKASAAEVTALCEELYQSRQVDVPELQKIRHRLTLCTAREFEWHKERLRKVALARYDEQMYEAEQQQYA